MLTNLLATILMSVLSGSVQTEPPTTANSAIENAHLLNRFYPESAKKAGEHGRVKFETRVDRQGSVKSCEVVISSGFSRLDKQTCEIITQYAIFKPQSAIPGAPQERTILGEIEWKLSDYVPATTLRKTAKSEKVSCKKFQRTGSLLASTRTCGTESQWSSVNDGQRDDLDEIRKRGFTKGN